MGEVIVTDPVIQGSREPRFGAQGFHYIELSAAFLGAVLVLVIGGMWRRSKQAAHAERVRRPSSNLQGSVIRNGLLPEMVRIGFDLAHRERENLSGGPTAMPWPRSVLRS